MAGGGTGLVNIIDQAYSNITIAAAGAVMALIVDNIIMYIDGLGHELSASNTGVRVGMVRQQTFQ